MEVSVLRKVTTNIEKLVVKAYVRYWEDSEINGIPDSPTSPEMPMINGHYWEPTINLDEGRIIGWPEGIVADINYKVCDEFECIIPEIDFYYSGYVPRFMSPLEENYGDYITMKVSGSGYIEGWSQELVKKFLEKELFINVNPLEIYDRE